MEEKSKFMQLFEKLTPEEQARIAQVAIKFGELIEVKGSKKSNSDS